MAIETKRGPLTRDDLLAIWQTSTVDESYSAPLLEAGDGRGLEVHSQYMAQVQRVSEAIDRSLQAMFILPWSGQTNEPAGGARRATVTLTFTRTKFLDRPLVLAAGVVFYESVVNDYGVLEAEEVLTELRYTLLEDFVFAPGESGPFQVRAIAESSGYSYNNPPPGSISLTVQTSSTFFNDRATVLEAGAGAAAQLLGSNHPDVPVPGHVGQYVLLTAGVNTGRVLRVAGYGGPVPNGTPPVGGSFTFDPLAAAYGAALGQLSPGEPVTQVGSGSTFVVLKWITPDAGATATVVLRRLKGPLVQGQLLVGDLSGATVMVTSLLESPDVAGELGTAAWRILSWPDDLGFVVTNENSPVDGRPPVLDAVGAERKIGRAPGETDESYRRRVATIADTISPNAIRRAANRILAPYGRAGCLRETGLPKLRGFFFDTTSGLPGGGVDPNADFFWDFDLIVLRPAVGIPPPFAFNEPIDLLEPNPISPPKHVGWFGGTLQGGRLLVVIRRKGDWKPAVGRTVKGRYSGLTMPVAAILVNGLPFGTRFHYWFDTIEMRAFFLMGVPKFDLGDFGFFWGDQPPLNSVLPGTISGGNNAYDSSPFLTFYDGFPVDAAILYRSIWQAIEQARAGGVGFDLYQETEGCGFD